MKRKLFTLYRSNWRTAWVALSFAALLPLASCGSSGGDDGGGQGGNGGSGGNQGDLPATITVKGSVSDNEGAPVENANVIIAASTLYHTNSTGRFEVTTAPPADALVLELEAVEHAQQILRIPIKPEVTTYYVPAVMQKLRTIALAPGDTEAPLVVSGDTLAVVKFNEPVAQAATLQIATAPATEAPGELSEKGAGPNQALQSGAIVWVGMSDANGNPIPVPPGSITVNVSETPPVASAGSWQGLSLDKETGTWTNPATPSASTETEVTVSLPSNDFVNVARSYVTACVKGKVARTSCGGGRVEALGPGGIYSFDSIGAEGGFCVTGALSASTTLQVGAFSASVTMPATAGNCGAPATCVELAEELGVNNCQTIDPVPSMNVGGSGGEGGTGGSGGEGGTGGEGGSGGTATGGTGGTGGSGGTATGGTGSFAGCDVNEHVVNNACVPCPGGSTNPAGDDATGADTSCDATLCDVDQRVVNNACVPCPGGSTNPAGDDATGPDTECGTGTCAGVDVCSADYPCEELAPSYTCRGQFADWTPSDSPTSFTDNGDGTVSDARSGLSWQQAVDAGFYDWAGAKAYCANLTLVGTGWRLPTEAELESIVDFRKVTPSIDATAFPNTPVDWFWSSSAYVGASGNAWFVHFNDGFSSYGVIDISYRVRCVR